MASSAQVRELADAYRRAMHEGDREFVDNALERKILHALVAASVADTARWVRTRVPAGDDVARPLVNLVPLLNQGNVVGQGLEYAQGKLLKEAKGLLFAAVGVAAWPLWFVSVLGFFGGLLGFAHEAGSATAKLLVPLFLAGGGTALYGLVRTLSMSGPALAAMGAAAGSLVSAAGSVGKQAERVFADRLTQPLAQVYGAPPSTGITAAKKVRGLAQTLVWFTYGFLFATGAFFIAGASNATGELMAPDRPVCQINPYAPGCPIPTFPMPSPSPFFP